MCPLAIWWSGLSAGVSLFSYTRAHTHAHTPYCFSFSFPRYSLFVFYHFCFITCHNYDNFLFFAFALKSVISISIMPHPKLSHTFKKTLNFYWRVVDLQCCASFRGTAEWFMYIWLYSFFFRFFSHMGYYRIYSRIPSAIQ